MTPAEVIELFDDPPTLLRRCYLHIAGGATRTPKQLDAPLPPVNGQAAVQTFKVAITHSVVRGFTTGTGGVFGKQKTRAYVRIYKLGGQAKQKAELGADEFNAYYVPMVQTSDVTAGTSHYSLPTGLDALELMVTSKLSGCTFGVGSDGMGTVLVSHVQPDMTIDDPGDRAHSLDVAVTSGFHTTTGEFRKGGRYKEYAAVIGRRSGPNWKFYLQAVGLGASSGWKKSDYVISKVEVID
jgi:hypothetical protein